LPPSEFIDRALSFMSTAMRGWGGSEPFPPSHDRNELIGT
jgi:hypothetical protein